MKYSYPQSFQDVLNYIDQNLDDNLNLATLCKITHYSKFHFHRQFSAYLGLSTVKYIQLQRLKKSAYQLSFRKQFSITEIAFDAGFENTDDEFGEDDWEDSDDDDDDFDDFDDDEGFDDDF